MPLEIVAGTVAVDGDDVSGVVDPGGVHQGRLDPQVRHHFPADLREPGEPTRDLEEPVGVEVAEVTRIIPAVLQDLLGLLGPIQIALHDLRPFNQDHPFGAPGQVGLGLRVDGLDGRAGQAALTSCAWFFDDFGGLEGRVALRWAARAVELAAEHSASVENELLERLRGINSNKRENGDAATLYLSLKTREARGRV